MCSLRLRLSPTAICYSTKEAGNSTPAEHLAQDLWLGATRVGEIGPAHVQRVLPYQRLGQVGIPSLDRFEDSPMLVDPAVQSLRIDGSLCRHRADFVCVVERFRGGEKGREQLAMCHRFDRGVEGSKAR